jgi:hypothetical protein
MIAFARIAPAAGAHDPGLEHLHPDLEQRARVFVQGNRVNNQRLHAKSRQREKGPLRFQIEYRLAVRMADRSQKRPAMRVRARGLGGPWALRRLGGPWALRRLGGLWALRRLGVELLLVHPIAPGVCTRARPGLGTTLYAAARTRRFQSP